MVGRKYFFFLFMYGGTVRISDMLYEDLVVLKSVPVSEGLTVLTHCMRN